MKRLFLLSGLFALGLQLSSCQKTKDQVNEATEFDINYSASLPVPSSSVSASCDPIRRTLLAAPGSPGGGAG